MFGISGVSRDLPCFPLEHHSLRTVSFASQYLASRVRATKVWTPKAFVDYFSGRLMFSGEAFVALQVVFKCVRVITHPLSQVIWKIVHRPSSTTFRDTPMKSPVLSLGALCTISALDRHLIERILLRFCLSASMTYKCCFSQWILRTLFTCPGLDGLSPIESFLCGALSQTRSTLACSGS